MTERLTDSRLNSGDATLFGAVDEAIARGTERDTLATLVLDFFRIPEAHRGDIRGPGDLYAQAMDCLKGAIEVRKRNEAKEST